MQFSIKIFSTNLIATSAVTQSLVMLVCYALSLTIDSHKLHTINTS